ncbi:DEAD/DEAH box helicase [Sphingomonas psychrotolerans]|uniref:Transcription-repair-coupling factor n=1 Tax=Sphingomonas psychrotolerans TaxID=1327635 RepID=A0ABU3N1U7_9SPHN|nr:helicase-related protein [Sphingomonas psychrotolerans]MDT8758448.1 DEAD/DEAH box helicase [Sphingomonas psychrotolerans]
MTSIAWTAAEIARVLKADHVLHLCDDDQQAQAVTAALRAMLPNVPVVFVPSSDALPGDRAPASPANIGTRVAALRALRVAQQNAGRDHIACVMSGEAAARLYPPPTAFDQALPRISVGDALSIEQLSEMLEQIGYFADDRVDEPGEMGVRGEVVDIFPADAGLPARIEIAGGKVTSIRSYDAVSQRSVCELDALEIGRAAEPSSEGAASIFAHLADGTIILSEKADKRRRRFLQLATDAARGQGAKVDAVSPDAWASAVSKWREVTLGSAFEPVPRFAETRSPLAALARFVKPLLETRAFVLAGSERDLRFLRTRVAKRIGLEMMSLADWSEAEALPAGAAGFLEMPADSGFVDEAMILVAAADLLGSRALSGDEAPARAALWTIGGGEVRIGDVIVHEDHGVGVVAGLEPAPEAGGGEREMIALEYAGGSRRLVAVDEAHRIWRYGADADAVTLDKLDGSSWLKRRAEISGAIAESAKGLAALAAARAELTAPILDPDPAAYEKFASGFPYNETADQARAIAAVRADLACGKPMDRLVVGDVGYGKTEVALRAAALAALAGHQVVVAAPTTVLVRQHLASFRRRFEGTGLNVAGLSRLSSPAEKKAVKAGLADGSVHVVIGTGVVMGKGIDYARLGLVVIDEEQRFGAADKARLRGSGEIHLLSLSATPIPRTLQMALVGIQQMSIIATPPARRQPIRTSLDRYDDSRIRTALLREKGRGGQSFVVVPRIEDMAKVAEKLRRAAPDLTLIEAHGKMPPAEIDAAMVGFAEGHGDILLATNIIEAGLDVPRANTMIVWRADRFGLAQLHQLRGRVGRGTRRGQVLLLTSDEDAIGERTLKRLRTLSTFDQLGAGFEISAQDLDMRGAGDLLGETQAGHMKLIGVDLYQHLLGQALRQARGEPADRWIPELNLGIQGALPASWIPDADIRLTLYVRLGRMAQEAEIDAFEEELTDRFGPLPEAAVALMAHARLRMAARMANIARIDAGPSAIALTPGPGFRSDADRHGLTAKNGRLLLAVTTDQGQPAERVQALLEEFAA